LDEDTYSVDRLSRDLSMSRMQLHRKIKALTGNSTTEFINNFKLDLALEKLRDPELNVSEIAYALGYSDPAYFTRLFSKKYGKSPSDYRKAGK